MRSRHGRLAAVLILGATWAVACSSGGGDSGSDCAVGGAYYDPTWAVSTEVLPPVRGYRDLRGIIHSHSIYSHDGCDGRSVRDPACLDQLRQALCTTRQDFIMLTDHAAVFAEHEFPEVLLYKPEQGDELAYDGEGRPIANRIPCPGGLATTLMAGTENDLMAIHLHGHPAGSVEDRYDLYDRRDAQAAVRLRELGASVIVNHDEGWSIPDLLALAPDGIEVFNLHAAIDPDNRPDLGVGPLSFLPDLLAFLADDAKPAPNLTIMTFWPATTAWTDRWDALLAVRRCIGIAATDAHRNALPFPLSDGERADGYRRMMQFFSNHVLATGREPADLEDALDRGRLYAAFEFLGMPVGFDFHATDGTGAIYEMGDEVRLGKGLKLRVVAPRPYCLDPTGPRPEIALRLIRVDSTGSAVVAESATEITYEVSEPGAYRAEVVIVPLHLSPFLGSNPSRFVREYPWIYANPIYVRPG